MNHDERVYLRMFEQTAGGAFMGPMLRRFGRPILRRIFNQPRWFDPEQLAQW